jgi:hypothetical protein
MKISFLWFLNRFTYIYFKGLIVEFSSSQRAVSQRIFVLSPINTAMLRVLPLNDIYRPVGKFVNVEFGNPKRRNCEGMGICNVELAGSVSSLRAHRCKACFSQAFLSYSPRKGRVQLEFRRRDISSRAYTTQFKNGLFRVEEDVAFPQELIQACGLPKDAIIKRGLYPIQEKGGRLRFVLPLGYSAKMPFLGITDHRISSTF